MASERAILEWRARVRAEYGSASLTAQVLHWMIVCGLPMPLLHQAARIVTDELDHAALAAEVVEALGGAALPEAVTLGALRVAEAPEGLGASLIDEVLRSFCLGETLAVPLFAAMRAGAEHPVARAALDRVLRDEARHRAFGWDCLDGLLALDAVGVRSRAAAVLPGMVEQLWQGFGELPAHTPISAAERAVGLLDGAQYAEITRAALVAEIGPRFAKRGIALGWAP